MGKRDTFIFYIFYEILRFDLEGTYNGSLLATEFLRYIASVYFPMFRLFHGALFLLVKTICLIAPRTPHAIVGKTDVNYI